jgi:AraC family transcriptional activator of pobA
LETLDERSRPNAWDIRPHAHANLSHFFHISVGGGQMRAEDRVIGFDAPCVVLVPAGVIHGFRFEAETVGTVLTVADDYFRDLALRDPDLADLFRTADVVALGDVDLTGPIGLLARELNWAAPGHAAAVEGCLQTIIVQVLRLLRRRDGVARDAVGPQARLVARFREVLERRFRSGDGIEAYADVLGVTVSRLRQACLRMGGGPPIKLIHERMILEARRALLYSNMTVAEVGFEIGLVDPAYFSRFFTKAVGLSPRAFRSSGGSFKSAER